MRLYWPVQVASIALDRDTRHRNTSKRRTGWLLTVGGPFCFWPRRDAASTSSARAAHAVAHTDVLASALSALLALPVFKWHDGEALSLQVHLTEEEWQRIFAAEYKKQT